MAEVTKLLALYGGTFDPIHYGHLYPVAALAGQCGLGHVKLMPNNVPPHRHQPGATSQQRLDMIKLAIANEPLFSVDERELLRQAPSYTVETLEALRQEIGESQPLAFIIGQDSLVNLANWHRYQDLTRLCHLLVMRRPGYPIQMNDSAGQRWLDALLTDNVEDLHQRPGGHVYLANTPLYPISATEIRQRVQGGLPCDGLLPPVVLDYILRHRLYRTV